MRTDGQANMTRLLVAFCESSYKLFLCRKDIRGERHPPPLPLPSYAYAYENSVLGHVVKINLPPLPSLYALYVDQKTKG